MFMVALLAAPGVSVVQYARSKGFKVARAVEVASWVLFFFYEMVSWQYSIRMASTS